MTTQQLKDRTKRFSLKTIDLVEQLPGTSAGRTITNQLIRSGTSVGAKLQSGLSIKK